MTLRHATIADAAALARVHIDTWHATYRGIVPDEYLDRMSYERRTGQWENDLANVGPEKAVFVVEEDDGKIIGFAIAGPQRERTYAIDGELYAIYVLPEAQGKGAGSMLFDASSTFLAAQGLHGMLVWVLVDNPSRGFYEARGGREIGRKTFTIGGVELEGVGYGWDEG